MLEGFNAGVPINKVLVAQGAHEDALLERIKKCANRARVQVNTVPREKMDDISARGSHQGVMAKVAPFEYASLNSIIDKENTPALVIVLDHITDAGNLGAIIRSADAAGAAGVIVPNKRSAQVNASTYKTSAGAVLHMPVAQVSNIAAAINALKAADFWVAGASEQKSETIWKANLGGKVALVFGNEERGISRLVQRECDFFVSLPMCGAVESLNVAQAATTCMYEWLRQNS